MACPAGWTLLATHPTLLFVVETVEVEEEGKKRKNQRERRYIERCSVPKSTSSFRLAFPLSFVFFLSLFTTADVERVLSLLLSLVRS
jgi:hypothetical protein